jgi:hypothetical protein
MTLIMISSPDLCHLGSEYSFDKESKLVFEPTPVSCVDGTYSWYIFSGKAETNGSLLITPATIRISAELGILFSFEVCGY